MPLKSGLFGLLFLYHSLAWSELTIRVVDKQGQPVADAVVALPVEAHTGSQPEPTISDNTQPAIMDQVEKQFLPHVLVINKGQQVVFPNSDQVRHHVYSFSAPNEFEIKLYTGDQAKPVRFEHSGIAVLGCNIHDQMVGYIYIADNETVGLTDASGLVSFESLSPVKSAPLELTVWHSRLSSSKTERLMQTLQAPDSSGIWQVELDLLSLAPKESRKFKPRFQ